MSVVHGTNNAIKKNILSTLGNIKRIGMNALVGWLEATDYFCAPCSRDHHLNTIGGLARHSFNMYWCLIDYVTKYSIEVDADSIAICSLLHDVCKIGRYERGTKRQECNGKWSTVECWVTTNDLFPIGHGEKSVILIQRFIQLTERECLAIRFHMGAYTDGVDVSTNAELKQCMNKAFKDKFVFATHMADMETTHFVD